MKIKILVLTDDVEKWTDFYSLNLANVTVRKCNGGKDCIVYNEGFIVEIKSRFGEYERGRCYSTAIIDKKIPTELYHNVLRPMVKSSILQTDKYFS